MSPFELEILLHYHTSPKPHPRIAACPQILVRANQFVDEGVFTPGFWGENTFSTTQKGEGWIRMILDTPYPEPALIDPRTEKIVFRYADWDGIGLPEGEEE